MSDVGSSTRPVSTLPVSTLPVDPAEGGAATAHPLPSPEPGSPAVIVPMDGEEPVAGEVTVWSSGGIVVTGRVLVGAGAASALSGRRVWVRARAGEGIVVVQAVAQPVAGRRGEVELTGVVGMATEARRGSVRARLQRSVLLLQDGAPSRGTWTIDLSSTGCRVRLPHDQDLSPGDRVQAVVTPAQGDPMWLVGEVVRVDLDAREAAVHFVEVSEADRNALERDVLHWLSEQAG